VQRCDGSVVVGSAQRQTLSRRTALVGAEQRGSEGVRVWGASVGEGGGREKEEDGIGLARADAV
jgi:hypothetical protein